MFDKDNHTQIQNLTQLNAKLAGLVPALVPPPPYNLGTFATLGANTAMLDAAIGASNFNLYDSLTSADLVLALQTPLAALVNTHPAVFQYDTHGDKHFPGGPQGTKFNAGGVVQATKASINPLLTGLINPHRGRIRRDANGHNQTYYLTDSAKPWTVNGPNLCIQVDYVYQPESFGYHGYPDAVPVFTLSRTKGGAAIPL
jgi:hypothetical protein